MVWNAGTQAFVPQGWRCHDLAARLLDVQLHSLKPAGLLFGAISCARSLDNRGCVVSNFRTILFSNLLLQFRGFVKCIDECTETVPDA